LSETKTKPKKQRKTITIGSDPEFIFVQGNEKHSAADVFRTKGIEGSSSSSVEIGVDGCSSTGELRPKYATTPKKHFENIKKLIEKLTTISGNDFKVFSGNYPHCTSLGGHIHFGNFSRTKYMDRMVAALDIFLSLPLLMIEETDSAKMRRKSSYGKLSDARRQEWGVEYRSPASWLTTPQITESVLCLSYVIVDHVINNDNFTPNKYLLTYIKNADAFNKAKKDVIEKFIVYIYEEVTKMDLFSTYKDEINVLFNMVLKHEEWDTKEDILKAWGFKNETSNKTALFFSRDKGLKLSCDGVKLDDTLETNLQLYIYGIKQERGDDVIVASNKYLQHTLQTILKKKHMNGIQVEVSTLGGKASSYVSSIGFPLVMRQKKDTVKDIVQGVIRTYEYDVTI